MKGDKLKKRIPEWTDRSWRKGKRNWNGGHSKRHWDTVGESEDLTHNLLHAAGNQHRTLRMYTKGRKMSSLLTITT